MLTNIPGIIFLGTLAGLITGLFMFCLPHLIMRLEIRSAMKHNEFGRLLSLVKNTEFPLPADILHYAAGHDQIELIDAVLAKGVDINHHYNGTSALVLAVCNNRFNAAKHLIGKGADVNATSTHPVNHGSTALHFASKFADSKIVELLLFNQAHVDQQTSIKDEGTPGTTALMCAVTSNNATVVKLLLRFGADKTIKTSSGHSRCTATYFATNDEIRNLLTEQPPTFDDVGRILAQSPLLASYGTKQAEHSLATVANVVSTDGIENPEEQRPYPDVPPHHSSSFGASRNGTLHVGTQQARATSEQEMIDDASNRYNNSSYNSFGAFSN